MPEKQKVPVVKAGDVTQRVGVEVIRARGVDVEKLIKMLIANAAAEFASTYYYYTILRMHLAGHEDYKEICEDARLEDRARPLGTDCASHLRTRWRVAQRSSGISRPSGLSRGQAAGSADRGQHPDTAAGVGTLCHPQLD